MERWREFVAFEMVCPPGLLWDEENLVCNWAHNVDCIADRCNSSSIQSVSYRHNCNTYWACRNMRQYEAQCCPEGERYDEGLRSCIQVPGCNDTCPIVPSEPENVTICDDLKPHPTDPTKYIQLLYGFFEIERDCPQGTEFNIRTCDCSIHIPATMAPFVCEPWVDIPFDDDLQDHSENRFIITAEGGVRTSTIEGGVGRVGYFMGSGRLIINGLATVPYGRLFAIRFRFWPIERTDGETEECLVTNSNCDNAETVSVSIDRTTSTSDAYIRTGVNQDIVTNGYIANQWNEVEYRYNGTYLTLTINGIVSQTMHTGDITVIHTGIQIGYSCQSDAYFKGYIDEFKLYLCLPD